MKLSEILGKTRKQRDADDARFRAETARNVAAARHDEEWRKNEARPIARLIGVDPADYDEWWSLVHYLETPDWVAGITFAYRAKDAIEAKRSPAAIPAGLDYAAIAEELRKSQPRPDRSMDPGSYWDALGIHSLADAIEAVGKRT